MNAISQISSDITAAVAMDLAMELHDRPTVWGRHGIDPLHGEALLKDPYFAKMVDEAKREWASVTNAKQRIRLKAQLAVEDSISDLYLLACDTNAPAAGRVQAFKELVNLSGTAVTSDGSGVGGYTGPSVNIYLNGGDSPAMSITSNRVVRPEPEYVEYEEVTPGNQDGPAWGA